LWEHSGNTGQVVDQPSEISTELPFELSNDQLIEQLNDQSTEKSTEKPEDEKHNCNKGSGNGAEGCDPGNHPERGNKNEGGNRHLQDSKKDKKY